MDNFKEKTLNLHKKNRGKLDLIPNIKLETIEDMSLAYTPGVAIPCMEIYRDKSLVYDYTIKGKTVAIVTDGTAVLGLGDIGPLAALPVMEGKSALLYKFSKIQAFPICLNTKDPDEIIQTVLNISPSFSAIMLEDIKAPQCVYIENELQKRMDIPVFHDDQHGTAIVVGAALKNAARFLKKDLTNLKVLITGTGAAGNAIIRILNKLGVKEVYAVNKDGVLNKKYIKNYNVVEQSMLEDNLIISPNNNITTLEEVIKDKDVFIGVSAKNILTKSMVESMSEDKIVFALANPDPEIAPDLAKAAGAKIIGTGRSDFPNQINNVLVFPGLMKGVLESRCQTITYEMKINALNAIADLIKTEDLRADYILPDIFDERVVKAVSEAVKSAKK